MVRDFISDEMIWASTETCRVVGCKVPTFDHGEMASRPVHLLVHGDKGLLIDRFYVVSENDEKMQRRIGQWIREIHLLQLAELEGCCG